MHDVSRAAGRTGLGAVMGSKNLRAVAVRGSGRVELADSELVGSVARWFRDNWPQFAQHLHDNGTLGGLAILNKLGGLPTRNFQQGEFEGAQRIAGETMTERLLVGRDTCFACPVYCKRRVKCEGRYAVDPVYGGPEYETVAALGSLCGIDDLEAIACANQLCNAYGLDTISAGVTIAWAMECFERGLLTEDDTGGLALRFGHAEAMLALLEQIAHRQGFGALLAEGALRASRAIGRGTERCVAHVKGQEMPMHDPRIKHGMDLGYAISPTGADHNHNVWDHAYAVENRWLDNMRSLGILHPIPLDDLGPEKLRLAYYHTDWNVLLNCVGLCAHLPYAKEQVRDLVRGMTGWKTTVFELVKAGERAMAMARAFNHREGLSAADDVLPPRFSEPFAAGPSAGAAVPMEKAQRALDMYRGMRGWDPYTGAPSAAKLHELGLGWLAEE
jgi:aldehyde:ferredoxin oxidoreductase